MSGVFPTLAAFAEAGLRPRTPLAKAIVVALVIKLCVVVAMRIFLFGSDARVAVDEASMTRLFAPTAAASQR
jgi:hypothetical protein